ncbi:MAG: DNA polymerase III subunit alpha [bacterium]
MEPAQIPVQLRHLGFQAAALVDQNNLYGAIEFYDSAIANGIKPIIGAELTSRRHDYSLSLIAMSRKGYSNLCRIISDNNRNPDLDLLKEVMENSKGIGVLCSDPRVARELAKQIDQANIWVEVVFNRLSHSQIRTLLSETDAAKLRAVATWELVCEKPQDQLLARALMAIRHQTLISRIKQDLRHPHLEASLRVPKIVGDPSLLTETLRIADMADVDLELGKVHFPRMTAADGDSVQVLRSLCSKALPQKYPRNRHKARQRLQNEIETISTLGFSDYFLCVKKIVDFARDRGIAVAGRGSGASSIVAYLLGITQVDPIRENLYFERFLNRHRPDYPDIDLDIAWDRRDEVISFVYQEFGGSKAAMVSTRVRFETHSALGSVAKIFGFVPSEVRTLTKGLHHHASREEMERALIRVRPDLTPKMASAITGIASDLVGIPSHSSIHCGGMVVADTQLSDYTPLEVASKGIEVTQFDMGSIERIGLVKIDLLGNRALSIIANTKTLISKVTSSPKPAIDIKKLRKTLESGSTITCFQIESPAMRSLLKMLRARTFDDLTLALALVRPGPSLSGAKSKIISHRQNRFISKKDLGYAEAADGCLVYEEDVMKQISKATGLDLAEADIIRRLIKKDIDLARERFTALAEERGLDASTVKCVWEKLERFASYTFCKAHAASYARLAYLTAALKATYPVEFYASALSNHCGMYPLWVHVNEARRIGVSILLPDVNLSDEDFKVENGAIRTGLGEIKFVSKPTIQSIMEERRIRKFTSLADFFARIDVSKDEAIALIGSGALDGIGVSRSKALATYIIMTSRGKRVKGLPLIDQVPIVDLPYQDIGNIDLRRMEYEFLGFSPLIHPIYLYRLKPGDNCDQKTDGIPSDQSQSAQVFDGLLAAMRHHRSSKSGIWFLSLDNPEGMLDCTARDTMPLPPLEIGEAYRVTALPLQRNCMVSWRIQTIERLGESHNMDKILLDQIATVP